MIASSTPILTSVSHVSVAVKVSAAGTSSQLTVVSFGIVLVNAGARLSDTVMVWVTDSTVWLP